MTPKRPVAGISDAASASHLLSDLAGLGAAGAVVVELGPAGAARMSAATSGAIAIGVHRAGRCPAEGLQAFDILLSADPAAPRPWVGVPPARLDETIDQLRLQIERQPVAAAVAAQVLRATLAMSFEQSLVLESLGYSMLLASQGFAEWRATTPTRRRPEESAPRVLIEQDQAALRISLSRPGSRNAFDARMRDELVEALEFALVHPDAPPVTLAGQGPSFSAGGDLDEFGRADDVGRAHLIRTLRSPARLVHELGDRLTVRLHGACIGAGIEVAAAAARVSAAPGAFFRLPEVSMGLIPGAGGTASIPRRIGRRRACYMAISGADIDLETALAWGLVDAPDGAA